MRQLENLYEAIGNEKEFRIVIIMGRLLEGVIRKKIIC